MYRTMSGVIGFMVGGGLAYAVVACVFASFDNEDVATYAPIIGIPPGLVGGVIGAVIGVVMGRRLDD